MRNISKPTLHFHRVNDRVLQHTQSWMLMHRRTRDLVFLRQRLWGRQVPHLWGNTSELPLLRTVSCVTTTVLCWGGIQTVFLTVPVCEHPVVKEISHTAAIQRRASGFGVILVLKRALRTPSCAINIQGNLLLLPVRSVWAIPEQTLLSLAHLNNSLDPRPTLFSP